MASKITTETARSAANKILIENEIVSIDLELACGDYIAHDGDPVRLTNMIKSVLLVKYNREFVDACELAHKIFRGISRQYRVVRGLTTY